MALPPFMMVRKPPGVQVIEALTVSSVDTAVTGYHILVMSGNPSVAAVGDRIEQGAASTSIIGIINNLVFVTDSTGFSAGAANVYDDNIGTPINFATFDRKLLGTCIVNYISDAGVTTSSGRVTALANQGTVGAAMNMGDPGALFRPYYNATDANFNNYPSLEFKGATELNFMTKDSGPGGAPAITAADGFFVAKLNTDPPGGVTTEGFISFNGAAVMGPRYPRSTDGVVTLAAFTTVTKTAVDPATSLATPHLTEIISTGSEYTWRLNGTQQFTTGTNTVGWERYTYIGVSDETAAKKLDGFFVELFIFNAKLSTNYRTIFEYCVQTRYGVDIANV